MITINFKPERGRVVLNGEVVRYLRKQAGYTSKQLADAVGISHGSLSNYELNKSAPTKEVADLITDKLGVKPKEIIANYRIVLKCPPEPPAQESEKQEEPRQQSLFEMAQNVETIGRVKRYVLRELDRYADIRKAHSFAAGAHHALEDVLGIIAQVERGEL